MKKNKILTFPYGAENIEISLPDRIVFDGLMKIIEPPNDLVGLLKNSLENPIGCDRLDQLVSAGDKVLILIEDNTRNTPVNSILPILIDYLKACGILESDVEILTAPGTHRVMTEPEIIEKVGQRIFDSINISQHDFRDSDSLIDLGSVDAGDYQIPIRINKKVQEVDFIIGIGNIIPHCDAGYSGGAKILQPGICGYSTTAATHAAAALLQEIPLGVVENPCRMGMERVAKRAGLRFIVNTVMNNRNEVIDVVSGDYVRAHRSGSSLSKKAFEVDIPEAADIVIVSSQPADIDYWQAEKGIISAYFAVKEGGIIIFVAPCYEGLAHNHPRFQEWLKLSYREATDRIRKIDFNDEDADLVSADLAICNARVREKARIYCVSHGLSEEDLNILRYKGFEDLQSAIDAALAEIPDATIGLLPRGGDCLPVNKVA